jgi:hypothetical protein
MSVLLSPIGNGINFLSTTGQPLAGGQLFTYQAGSSTQLATYQDSNGSIPNSNPIYLGTDGRLPSELWLTQGNTYKFVLTDKNNNLIATYDNLYGILANATATASTFTAGMIMMWSGSIGTIPFGWQLCDGTNAQPDLRGKFIVGAGSAYSVNDTGGSADSVIVSHTHGATSTSTSSVSDPGHAHTSSTGGSFWTNSSSGNQFTGNPGQNITAAYINSAQTNITVTTSTSTTIASATGGVSGTGKNLPPYYALCYIVKL